MVIWNANIIYNCSFGSYYLSSFSGSRAESQTHLIAVGFFSNDTGDPQTWNIPRNNMALHRAVQYFLTPLLLFALHGGM